MNQNRNNKKLPFKFIFISYGIASIIAIGSVLLYENRHGTSSSGTNNQHVSTKTSMQQSAELALTKLSNEIVSWQLSESESEKQTIGAFKKYDSIAISESNSNHANAADWSEIHDNLLLAVQYAKSNSFVLMQSTWQGIGQELSDLQD